jgi:DNA-binding MarR family transcriptional regulator
MKIETSIFAASLYMLLLGLGLGFVMQVLIIAVQNAVDYHDLGVATSNAILFRFIGGSLGTSLLGAVLATQLNKNITPESVAASLHTVFLVAAAVSSLGLLLSLLLPERPLRQTIAAATEGDIGGDIGQAFAMPAETDSRAHLLRGLAVLADRDVLRSYIAAVVARAQLDLTIGAAWLLVQIEREPGVGVHELGRNAKVEASKVESSTTELLNSSLIERRSGNDVYGLTEEGCGIYNRLAVARREQLAELWPEWSPKKREDVAAILRRLARELVPEANG